ncbi:MAG: 2-dehydropantoate 2-reductase N-terminal domain-containing protein, partial [Candidatus Competibacterales bacterium]|nr:2-dehydropantoate 2-reductase N-terminal domain-containing protein [Candidatus Competibacterales bacterium]
MTACLAVLGAGSWGTALALQLTRTGQRVRLWGHDPDHLAGLGETRCNTRYLPDIELPPALTPTAGLETALDGADEVLVAVPSHAFATTLTRLRPLLSPEAGLAWATKGLETGSGRLLHEVAVATLGDTRPLAVVSGPSFAREVALGLPTALTVASPDDAYAARIAGLLHGAAMRA